MKTNHASWLRRILLLAGFTCGSAALACQAGEPSPLNPGAVAGPEVRAERLLEEPPTPRLMSWDDRSLYELRRRLAAEADAAKRRQQSNQPRPGQWRAGYGAVAPLALVPQHVAPNGEGGLAAYRAEIERLDSLIAQGRASAADLFLHGLIHYEAGCYPTALRDFDRAIRLSASRNDKFYSLRGLTHYALGSYRAAWTDLNEAVQIDANVRNLNNRGVIACTLGQTDRALQDFDAALRIRQFVTKTSPVFINQALAMSDAGRHEQAAADLKRVIETSGDPDAVAPGNYAAGFVYRRMGDFRRAGISFDIVVQVKRGDELTAHGQPGQSAIEQMPTEHTLIDEYAGEETAVDALLGRGIAHHELNQLDPAISDYSKAIRLSPKKAAAYVDRAAAYVERGDLDLAQRDLDMALRIDPDDAFALGNRGILRIRQGQAAQGQADLARCVELRPELKSAVQRISGQGQQSQAVGGRRPSPFAAAAEPVRKQYAAATPAEAVAWLAAAAQHDDIDGTIEALAAPLGPFFHRLRVASSQMDAAMAKYTAARNARSGNFFNPANSPMEQQLLRERRKMEAAQKFVVQEMRILSEESASNTGSVVRMVVRTIKSNARGETQTPKEIYYAVRVKNVWKLLPESSWVAVNDVDQLQFVCTYFDRQIARLQAMAGITEAAAQAMIDGKPVNELEMFVAWNQVSAGVPWPGKMGDEAPTMAEALFKAYSSMVWGQGLQQLYMAQRAQQLLQQQQQQPWLQPQPQAQPQPQPQSHNGKASPWGPVDWVN